MTDEKWTPGKILETSGFYWQTSTLHAGVKLDIFTRLADEARTGHEIAAALEAPPDPTMRLLDALTAMGLLEKTGAHYSNTPESRRFLSRTSEAYLGYIIGHHHHLVPSWARLDEAVVTGRPVRRRSVVMDDAARESFLMGMFNLANNLAPQLLPHIDAAGRRRMLDLGGGPGTYAIHFCRRYPEMTATVFDLPTTAPYASKTIAAHGLSQRITFTAGNYLSDEIPGGCDLAWLSHILHGEGPDACTALVRKAADALEPGGMLVVHEFILDNAGTAPLFPALFSLNMLLGTSEGRAYTEAEIMEMMARAGLQQIERVPVTTPNSSGIITSRKP